MVESGGPIWHYAMALRLILFRSREARCARRGTGRTSAGKSSSADEQRQAVLHQAQDHLAEALRLRPNWSRALMLEGLIYEESHQEDTALAKYLEAVQQGENSHRSCPTRPAIALRQGRVCRGQCPAPPTRRPKGAVHHRSFPRAIQGAGGIAGLCGGPQSRGNRRQ